MGRAASSQIQMENTALAGKPPRGYSPDMHGFAYRNGSLHCEDVDLQAPAGYQPLPQDSHQGQGQPANDSDSGDDSDDEDDEDFPTNFADFSRALNLDAPLDPNVQRMVENAQAAQKQVVAIGLAFAASGDGQAEE